MKYSRQIAQGIVLGMYATFVASLSYDNYKHNKKIKSEKLDLYNDAKNAFSQKALFEISELTPEDCGHVIDGVSELLDNILYKDLRVAKESHDNIIILSKYIKKGNAKAIKSFVEFKKIQYESYINNKKLYIEEKKIDTIKMSSAFDDVLKINVRL